ncbi:MAG: type II toxin-antitoxin system VapC family toxin [Planctomycetota bacterium]
MTRVLDAHALLVFLEKEPGFQKVEAFFVAALKRDDPLLMTSVNFGEVYYIVLRECGGQKAAEIEKIIQTLPIAIVDVDIALAKEAARFKSAKKLSYADCFAAALARVHKAELVTGDREFEEVEDQVKIAWVT